MGTYGDLGTLGFSTKPLRWGSRLIIQATMASGAGPGSRPMADITYLRISGQSVDDAIDVKFPSDNLQLRIYDTGVALHTLQACGLNVEFMLPQQGRRIGSVVMTRPAGRLIVARPDGCVHSPTTGEIAVAVYI